MKSGPSARVDLDVIMYVQHLQMFRVNQFHLLGFIDGYSVKGDSCSHFRVYISKYVLWRGRKVKRECLVGLVGHLADFVVRELQSSPCTHGFGHMDFKRS